MAYSDNQWPQGTQTLGRGLSIVTAVSAGIETLSDLAREIGCTRSTTQRLTAALLRQGWLRQEANNRYALGEQLGRLAVQAQVSLPLTDIGLPFLKKLSEATRDTVHLGIRSGDQVIYLHKSEGRRGLEMRSRIGQQMPLARTGIGRALLLDDGEAEWVRLYRINYRDTLDSMEGWLERMRVYQSTGCVFDLEDNEIGIHCVAAPVRDAMGSIVAAISVASASPYLPLSRMETLASVVRQTARQISEQLGWRMMSDVAD